MSMVLGAFGNKCNVVWPKCLHVQVTSVHAKIDVSGNCEHPNIVCYYYKVLIDTLLIKDYQKLSYHTSSQEPHT